MEKPEPYDNNLQRFETWNVRFKALLTSYDPRWEDILVKIESFGKTSIKQADYEDMEVEINLDASMAKRVRNSLYLNLLAYAKGDRNARIVSDGSNGAYENRSVHFLQRAKIIR